METAGQGDRASIGRLICAKYLLRSGSLVHAPHVALLIDEYLIELLESQTLEAACEHGAPIHELEFILSRTAPNWDEAVLSAARGGHLHVFRWMAGRQDGRGPWDIDFRNAVEEAAALGHLEVVKHFFHPRHGVFSSSGVLGKAAGGGHLALVQWLCQYTNICHIGRTEALISAARNGWLDIVQWLHRGLSEEEAAFAMRIAAHNGHLEMLQWLHEQINCSVVCSKKSMDGAAKGGHFHIIKWLFGNCHKGCSKYAAIHAARNGDLAMIQWISKHFDDQFSCGVMDSAVEWGHLDVVRWLHEHRSDGTQQAMDTAARCGHLELVRWLHNNRSEGCTTDAMDWAAENGHLEVVKWLHENRKEGCTIEAMNGAVKKGHLHVVQWLHENRREGCSDIIMERAAWNGHLSVVRYLDVNTIQRASRWGLVAASRQGHLKVLLVLIHKYYWDNPSVSGWAHWNISMCFRAILERLSDECATPASSSYRGILESMEIFHVNGLHDCVCTMLHQAFRLGHSMMARRFFERRNMQEKRRYVVVAGQSQKIIILRWLLENGTPLDVPTALKLAAEHCSIGYIEVVFWLTESDRVIVVCESLQKS